MEGHNPLMILLTDYITFSVTSTNVKSYLLNCSGFWFDMKDSFIPHNNKNKHIRLIQDDDPTSVLGHFHYHVSVLMMAYAMCLKGQAV